MRSKPGPSTLAVHAGTAKRHPGEPVAGPVVQSSTFVSDPSGRGEVLYSRYGNNPNHLRVEQKIAALEGSEGCLVTGSGMGAMSAALLACLEAGDHLIAAEALYGGTRLYLERELGRLGIETTFADLDDDRWTDHVTERTRVLLAEIPANPLLRVPDPDRLARLAHDRGLHFLIDVTFATPINFHGLDHGADLVVHSATKYMGGHSDVTAGAVCGRNELVDRARDRSRMFGTAPDPHATWLLERGLKTLALRMERHNANGEAVASWADGSPEIARVHYIGLPSHPDHETARSCLSGFGGMIGLEVVGGAERATAMVEQFELITAAPSLGGVETLVSEPRFTSHAHMTLEQRAQLGIADGFLRISLGIEDADDIIEDLESALAKTSELGRKG